MKRRILFDASIYIQAIRKRRSDLLQWRRHEEWTLHFSAVVGSELLRGIQKAREARVIEALLAGFQEKQAVGPSQCQ